MRLWMKPCIPMGIFGLCGIIGLWVDWFFKSRFEGSIAHVPAHFLFGLGFPLAWVAILISGGNGPTPRWLARIVRSRFYIGAGITGVWSIHNELVSYWALNSPAFGAQWDHFMGDVAGVFVCFMVFRLLPRCDADLDDMSYSIVTQNRK